MRSWLALPFLALSFLLHAAEPNQGELHYRASLVFRNEKQPVVTRFVLMPTAIAETRNKVKKPRMGGWRLEAVQRKGETFAQAAVLARIEGLLFLSGPEPRLIQKPIFIRYEGKRCQVWQVPMPPGLHAYAYLVEAAPGLLALSYFSGSFGSGDLASVEIQLEAFHLRPEAAPAENGAILLATLQRLAKTPDNLEGGEERVEVAE
jgi:hypothetical protein